MRSISSSRERRHKALIGLFFLCVLLVGFLTASDYGRPWDESDEVSILRMNLWEYARILHMDETLFHLWEADDSDTLIAPPTPISLSEDRDHGIAAFYPLAGVVLDRQLDGSVRSFLWRLWCWVLFTLGAFVLYACCRALGTPRWAGLLAALFLLLSPRFFAEGHYNNKDVVLLSLSLCLLWQGLRLMVRPSYSRALLFSLAGAFAANTKIVGFALWGLVALFVLLRQLFQKNWNRRMLCIGLTALLSFLGFYALLTPALLKDPVDFIRYSVGNAVLFTRWANAVRFRGMTFDLSKYKLPWYYLPYMILATTPVYLSLLFVGGQAGAAVKLFRNRHALKTRDDLLGLLLCSLLWLLPLGFAVAFRARVYNGWRHFYFLYGYLLILTAWGVSALAKRLEGKRALRRVLCVGLVLCLLCSAVGICRWHPYQYAYYQPLVRLLTQPGDLELDYWNVSVKNALTSLGAQREGEITVYGADYWSDAGLRRTLPALEPALRARLRIVERVTEADYVLSNPTYALFSRFAPMKHWEKVFSAVSYDREIMTLYQTAPKKETQP